MLILGILGYMLTHIRENPPNPAKTHIYSTASATTAAHQPIQVYKCQDCLKWPTVQKNQWKPCEKTTTYPNKISQKNRRAFLVVFHGFFTAVSRVFHGRFTDCSRSRFCGKFKVGTFIRSYSVLYLVTSWSKMQTFAQSPCSQAHFTCIELNQMAFLSTYLLTIVSQHNILASWTKYIMVINIAI